MAMPLLWKKIALFLDNSLSEISNKFFEKNWDPENLGPNFGKYQCLLLLFIEQTGLGPYGWQVPS